ncbi:MAG TPA: hemerythrin domain-containing protein [Vicinamibacterales bacterium]|nr:hemerythrin domain-containing protein [Vicinamibacterales bacterium]
MLIKLGHTADHGFDEPLGLLSDCHRRIEGFLGAMIAVAGRGPELTPADRDLLERAVRYFATSAPRHTADEEDSLFPRLRESGDAGARDALATVQRLESDHRAAETRHAAVDRLATQWLTNGTLPAAQLAELAEQLEALKKLYAVHIHVEDQELFPAAARVLDAEQLHEIGREMADRRGVPFRPPNL